MDRGVFASYDLSCRQLFWKEFYVWFDLFMDVCYQEKMSFTFNSLEMQIFNIEIAVNPD